VNVSRRLVVIIFVVLACLFTGLVFWPFILTEIIRPISIVVWLLLRVSVLAIDQKYYWGALIFVMMFCLYRLLPPGQPATYPEFSESSNATLKSIGYWRNIFFLTGHENYDSQNLKRELIRLVITHYATKQSTTANFEIYEALQRKELPLPEQLHAYLFTVEPQSSGRSLKERLQTLANAPQKWLRSVSGQEAAEHKRMINEVLVFLETALEIKK
jgi:hypothetical protein